MFGVNERGAGYIYIPYSVYTTFGILNCSIYETYPFLLDYVVGRLYVFLAYFRADPGPNQPTARCFATFDYLS